MASSGWKQLLRGARWFEGEGNYPLPAYSEFMPPPRLGGKPYGSIGPTPLADDDPWGWHVSEYEELLELRPGLAQLAEQIARSLTRLARGESSHGLSRHKLANNPYWSDELAAHRPHAHERFVLLLSVALSRTQDDKGRVRWTFFGASEQGPARAFWRSFLCAPGKEIDAHLAIGWLGRLLQIAYGVDAVDARGLRRAGFRIFDAAARLPSRGEPEQFAHWRERDLPSWTAPLMWKPGQTLRGVRFLLTFEPFGYLPTAVRRAYLAGELHLLPYPGSLLFWGAQSYWQLARQLPLAMQISLQTLLARHYAPTGIRVPQSGWMHEPHPDRPAPDDPNLALRNTYKRTHRWARVGRDDDELAVTPREDKVAHVLFSTAPDDIGLYGKPMARNAQIWTHEFALLLDGPHADHADLERAAAAVREGGLFGYRFQFPAMRVGRHEVYWHRPLVAFLPPGAQQPTVFDEGPLGYLTAYRAPAIGQHKPPLDLARPLELWPRVKLSERARSPVRLFEHAPDERPHRTTVNVRKIFDTWRLMGEKPLSRPFARQLLTLPKHVALEGWLDSLPERAFGSQAGRALADELRNCLAEHSPPEAAAATPPGAAAGLTLAETSRRAFEVAYWKTIRKLAEGRYRNKVNADCSRDPATQAVLKRKRRDLEALGDYLLNYYARTVAEFELTGRALVGDLPFRWQTQFDYDWFDGWRRNQAGETGERDLIVVIPGRDRGRAVIMADHYDTAYMEDEYGYGHGGRGPRLAAHGADDNHSATAALMLGARAFLELSRARRLACDIWLIHLTGEEFPSDCLGARHLAQCLVEGRLKMRLHQPQKARPSDRDLSRVRVAGAYILDMVAHNHDHDRDVFQISPGASRQSMWLACQAHQANLLWNARAAQKNQTAARRGKGRGRRSADGKTLPAVAEQPLLSGEVRPPYDPRSTLFNTDGQILSDAGIPVVLFMENYDINRTGYHDSHDTMENIDLDYGAAVAAIAIESVARAATERPRELS